MKHLSNPQTYYVSALIFFAVMFFIFLPFFNLILWAVIIAAILNPLFKAILIKIPNRSVAAFIAVIIGLIVIAVPLFFVFSRIIEEMIQAARQLASLDMNSVANSISEFGKMFNISVPSNLIEIIYSGKRFFMQMLNDSAADLAGKTVVFAKNVLVVIFQAFISLITAYFLLVESHNLKQFALNLLPFEKNDFDIFVSRASGMIYAMVFGILLIALVQSLFAGIGMYFAGIPNVILLMALMIVAGIIPFLGTPVIWLPAVIFLFLSGETIKALLLFAWGAFFVGSIDNVLRPIIVGKKTSLHPLIVFFSIFGGIVIFGPAGIFAGPIIVVLAITFIGIAVEKNRSE